MPRCTLGATTDLQDGRVIFTMKWYPDNRWEGRNFEVLLDPVENQETAYALASSEGKNQD